VLYELSYHLKLQFIADATDLDPSFTAPLGISEADLSHSLLCTLLYEHSTVSFTMENYQKLEKIGEGELMVQKPAPNCIWGSRRANADGSALRYIWCRLQSSGSPPSGENCCTQEDSPGG
jgi:hypothetical protein